MSIFVDEKVLVAQSCPTLCNPVDCSPTGSFVCEIFQARISIFYTFYFITCLIILDRTSSIILSGSVESEHPCLVPDIRGEVFNLSPLSMMLWDCHTSPLLRCVLSIPNLLRVFIMMNVEFCQMLFLYIQMIIDSFLSFSNVMYDIH